MIFCDPVTEVWRDLVYTKRDEEAGMLPAGAFSRGAGDAAFQVMRLL